MPKALTFEKMVRDNEYLKYVLEPTDRITIYYINDGADLRLIKDILNKARINFNIESDD